MPVLSILRRTSPLQVLCPLRSFQPNTSTHIIKRLSHDFEIRGSDWMRLKFLDLLHYYTYLSIIFYGGIALITNLTIGPATLAEIPEGYKPKYWEYYRHPISRAWEKYLFEDPQQTYETSLAKIYEEYMFLRMKALDERIKKVMKRRKDYRAYYSRPVDSGYVEYSRFANEASMRYISQVDND